MTATAFRRLRPSRRALEVLLVVLALLAAGSVPPAAANEDDVYIVQTPGGGDTLLGLDFHLYRSTVEPIFLHRRPGNARCVVCHSAGGGNSFLEPLPPGPETWERSSRSGTSSAFSGWWFRARRWRACCS